MTQKRKTECKNLNFANYLSLFEDKRLRRNRHARQVTIKLNNEPQEAKVTLFIAIRKPTIPGLVFRILGFGLTCLGGVAI